MRITILLILIGVSSYVGAYKHHETLVITLRFHLVQGMYMSKDGVSMDDWITEILVNTTVIPELNRIWDQANIKFELESFIVSPINDLSNKQKKIQYILNAKRDAQGKSDNKRIKKLNQLIDWKHHNYDLINIYIVPYLGESSQGNASKHKNRIFIAQWTDKPSKGKRPPQRFKLIENKPFRTGSFSRTLAHEIGHIFGLKHPDKTIQTQFHRLMGGKKKGYKLIEEEIKTARFSAEILKSTPF